MHAASVASFDLAVTRNRRGLVTLECQRARHHQCLAAAESTAHNSELSQAWRLVAKHLGDDHAD